MPKLGMSEKVSVENNDDEIPETGQIQAKDPSGEGRRPKWRRMKA